jgi:hypothetical protein
VKEVHCPYFKEKVAFNAKGLEHLKFKGNRQARSHQDQYIRFRLISLAPKILESSHTLQGMSERRVFEKEKTHGHWQSTMRPVTYYEFVAVVKDIRVRVIVKQVEDGPKYFWSIIPFWKSDKLNGNRVIHSGKPETD